MTTKYLKHNGSGGLTETTTVSTSAGAGDSDKIPSLNGSGILDDSIINASATSSANKIVKMNGSGIIAPTVLNGTQSSAGAGDAAKVVQLDSAGRIDNTMMPVGIGAETVSIVASEALSSGNLVNIYDDSGTPKVRKADASNGREANGFVLASVSSSASATVYLEGTVTGLTGLTAGPVYLSGSTPGATTNTAPTTSGYIVQRVGTAVSSTAVTFSNTVPITLA